MATVRPQHPVLLIVIDGWGVDRPGPANAVTQAKPAVMERLARDFPSTTVAASGPAVGLPEGQMGNSEVGHLTIGCGRIVLQEFVRITQAAREGRMLEQPATRDLLEYCAQSRQPLHLVGLLGPGGVHSHEDHLFALLAAARKTGVAKILVHHVLDGRDTPPRSALAFVDRAQKAIDATPGARVATVSGRYWTMDRDKRWERTEQSYRMLTESLGHHAKTAREAVEAAYARNQNDEFVEPTIVGAADPVGAKHGVFVYNFRPDRVRQIVRALMDPRFKDFRTKPLALRLATMTRYDETFAELGVAVAYAPEQPENTLGELYSALGLRQLRIAETEKYAHVTYFFSGGREEPLPGEDRLLVQSPKVATYDLAPAMGAEAITDQLLARLAQEKYDLVVLNFANPDMVGHTGHMKPTVEAVRVVDACIGRIVADAGRRGYVVAITADHGNAESMVDANGQPKTAHTLAPVPFILVHDGLKRVRLRSGGGLANVAATLLEVAGLPCPNEISEPSLAAAEGTPVERKPKVSKRAS